MARHRYLLFFSLGIALMGAVGFGLVHRPPSLVLTVLQPPPTPLPTPSHTPAPLRCHVVGAVNRPGVYTLPPDALVQDAVQAAGGPTADADLEQLNLAAALQDQEQILVPSRAEGPAPAPPGSHNGPSALLVNINTADIGTLQTLTGIGPVLAQRIIDYRDLHGPFDYVDDLILVKGIGPAILEKLRPLITTRP